MSRLKIFALIALITLAFSVALVGNSLAAEKVKARNVNHTVKWEQINVGDEDGHVVAVEENKGITTNLERKGFGDGWSVGAKSLYDMNLKTGLGSGHGYGETIDRDGDKCYWTWEGKGLKGGKFGTGYWAGTFTFVKGTGKFEGIQGKGTFQTYTIGGQAYADWEAEVELPR